MNGFKGDILRFIKSMTNGESTLPVRIISYAVANSLSENINKKYIYISTLKAITFIVK